MNSVFDKADKVYGIPLIVIASAERPSHIFAIPGDVKDKRIHAVIASWVRRNFGYLVLIPMKLEDSINHGYLTAKISGDGMYEIEIQNEATIGSEPVLWLEF